MECRVEFDYDAQEDDELTIKKGDIIRNVSQVEEGWMKGELNGREGVFPDNFVKVIIEKSRVQDKSGASDDKQINKRVRVLHPYTARLKDELSLTANTYVEIICEIEDGWLKAQQNGRVGVIPANFVDYTSQNKSLASNGPNNASVNSNVGSLSNHTNDDPVSDSNKAKKVGGIGFGNIFNGQKIQLRSGGNAPGPTVTNRDETRRNEDIKSSKEYVKVKFPYKAENSDELDLEPGEIIVILDKNLEDEGWWKGELPNRKIGVFPDNFVEPIASSLALELIAQRPSEVTSHSEKKFVPPVPPHKPNNLPTASNTQPVQTKRNQLPLLSNPPISQTSPVASQNSGINKMNGRDVLDLGESDVPAPLNSLTSDRPKQPAKRPPSKSPLTQPTGQAPSSNKSPSNANSANSDIPVASAGDGVMAVINEFRKKEQDFNKIEMERPSARKSVALPRSNIKPINNDGAAETTTHNITSRIQPSNVASGDDFVPLASFNELQKEMAEFKRQLNHIKETTVSRSSYEALKSDYNSLKSELDSLKSTMGNRLQDLMSEIDEEKKLRMADHVEMKRIRKLVMEIDNKKLLN